MAAQQQPFLHQPRTPNHHHQYHTNPPPPQHGHQQQGFYYIPHQQQQQPPFHHHQHHHPPPPPPAVGPGIVMGQPMMMPYQQQQPHHHHLQTIQQHSPYQHPQRPHSAAAPHPHHHHQHPAPMIPIAHGRIIIPNAQQKLQQPPSVHQQQPHRHEQQQPLEEDDGDEVKAPPKGMNCERCVAGLFATYLFVMVVCALVVLIQCQTVSTTACCVPSSCTVQGINKLARSDVLTFGAPTAGTTTGLCTLPPKLAAAMACNISSFTTPSAGCAVGDVDACLSNPLQRLPSWIFGLALLMFGVGGFLAWMGSEKQTPKWNLATCITAIVLIILDGALVVLCIVLLVQLGGSGDALFAEDSKNNYGAWTMSCGISTQNYPTKLKYIEDGRKLYLPLAIVTGMSSVMAIPIVVFVFWLLWLLLHCVQELG